MKHAEINAAIRRAQRCFKKNHWSLPPKPQWDVTDWGLGAFRRYGAVLVNLALEEEYSEKRIYLARRQTIPAHCHRKKKEDIIARNGTFAVRIWFGNPRRWTPRGRIQTACCPNPIPRCRDASVKGRIRTFIGESALHRSAATPKYRHKLFGQHAPD